MEIARDYFVFEKGTPQNNIWNWFDENHPKGVGYLIWKTY